MHKFTVLYSFKVKKEYQHDFVEAWSALTNLIYKFEGSYGSRLHKVDDSLFLGYAQWPDKVTWQNSGAKLPEAATQYRERLRECCIKITTKYEMETVVDLLRAETFHKSNPDPK